MPNSIVDAELTVLPDRLRLEWKMGILDGNFVFPFDVLQVRLYCRPFPVFGEPRLVYPPLSRVTHTRTRNVEGTVKAVGGAAGWEITREAFRPGSPTEPEGERYGYYPADLHLTAVRITTDRGTVAALMEWPVEGDWKAAPFTCWATLGYIIPTPGPHIGEYHKEAETEVYRHDPESSLRPLSSVDPVTSPHIFVPNQRDSEPADPFRPYVSQLYQRTADFLSRSAFSLIDLDAEPTISAVNAPPTLPPRAQTQFLDQLFYATGISDLVPGALSTEPEKFSSFMDVFEHYGGRVLLLGEPGAGKTVTLIAHTHDAAAKRLDDPKAPLPLLGLIAMWDALARTPLEEWLARGHDDLSAEDIRREIDAGRVSLLLDGLDELGSDGEEEVKKHNDITGMEETVKERYDPRVRFMEAVAGVLSEPSSQLLPASRAGSGRPSHSLLAGKGLGSDHNRAVVTCRVRDYAMIGQKMSLNGAVTLQPLTDDQLRYYLRDMPDLWEALEADPELREVARTPLLLFLFAHGYRDTQTTDEERLKLRDLRRSPGDLRNRIFERYVHGRYERERRRLNANLPFTLEEIYHVLGQVAVRNFVWLPGDNLLPVALFAEVLGKEHVPPFTELAVRLHLIAPRGKTSRREGMFRFVHLLLRDHFAFEPLLAGLTDSERSIRYRSAEALGRIGDTRAVEPLIVSLNDSERIVRGNAAEALGRIGDTRAVEPLIAALHDNEGYVRHSAADALVGIGGPAFEPLLAALHDSDWNVRHRAAEALGRIGDTRAVEPLIAALYDDDRAVRLKAVDALKRIGTPEALAAVEAWRKEQGQV